MWKGGIVSSYHAVLMLNCNYGIKVSTATLCDTWPVLNTARGVVNLISQLEKRCMCIGNPDEIFQPLIATRKGVFKNAQGKSKL